MWLSGFLHHSYPAAVRPAIGRHIIVCIRGNKYICKTNKQKYLPPDNFLMIRNESDLPHAADKLDKRRWRWSALFLWDCRLPEILSWGYALHVAKRIKAPEQLFLFSQSKGWDQKHNHKYGLWKSRVTTSSCFMPYQPRTQIPTNCITGNSGAHANNKSIHWDSMYCFKRKGISDWLHTLINHMCVQLCEVLTWGPKQCSLRGGLWAEVKHAHAHPRTKVWKKHILLKDLLNLRWSCSINFNCKIELESNYRTKDLFKLSYCVLKLWKQKLPLVWLQLCLVGLLVPEKQTSSNAVNQRGLVSGDYQTGQSSVCVTFHLCVCVCQIASWDWSWEF